MHSFDLFQNRNMQKWNFYHNPPAPRFTHEDKCLKFLSERKHQWSPAASASAMQPDLAQMDRVDGKAFAYHRIIQLSRDGRFVKNEAISSN